MIQCRVDGKWKADGVKLDEEFEGNLTEVIPCSWINYARSISRVSGLCSVSLKSYYSKWLIIYQDNNESLNNIDSIGLSCFSSVYKQEYNFKVDIFNFF